MNSEEHRYWKEMLGAYVMGDLEDEQRSALEAHIEGCAECRAEVEELRPVVEALSSVVEPDFIAPETPGTERPPEDLMDKTLAQIQEDRLRERSRRRRRAAIIGVAAAAVIAVISFAGVFGGSLISEEPPQETVAISGEPEGIEAEASLIAHTWGTETILTVEGLEAGENYTVALKRKDGSSAPSGTLIGTGDAPIECELNAAVLRENAEGLEVRRQNGDLVFAAEFPTVSGVTPEA